MASTELSNSARPARASSTRTRHAAFALQARFPPSFTAPTRRDRHRRSIPSRSLRILHSDSGHNTIFDLDVKGSARVKAMIVDWQYEPIKGSCCTSI